MADKTIEELIREASPEVRETYAELGGLETLLEQPSNNPTALIQQATAHGEFVRARAQHQKEAREREERKAKLAEETEVQATAAHARDERAAAEAEAQLMARLRKEYPPMTDQAWNAMWPQIRAQHFMEEHDRRMRAMRNDGNVLGDMRGSNF